MQPPADEVFAWRPSVAGVDEVFHAFWKAHEYPSHTHSTWTLLIVDDGAIGYGLDRHGHAAAPAGVTLLPPHVPHDGRALTAAGFRKRVIYLDEDQVGTELIGRAVDRPFVADRRLRTAVSRLDRALVAHDDLEAESRLAIVLERLRAHLGHAPPRPARPIKMVARMARERFDADFNESLTVAELADELGVSAAYLIRSFSRSYGIAPHRYVLGRRIEAARRLLLEGRSAAEVAIAAGFYDQAHLTRHFRRFLATTPGAYGAGPG